jgi:hypothetical protein
VIFKSSAFGWAALTRNLQRIVDGTSTYYSTDPTFAEIAKAYATDKRWGKSVCKILQINPRATMREYLGLAPLVRMTWNSNADILKRILAPLADSVGLVATPTLSVRTGGFGVGVLISDGGGYYKSETYQRP